MAPPFATLPLPTSPEGFVCRLVGHVEGSPDALRAWLDPAGGRPAAPESISAFVTGEFRIDELLDEDLRRLLDDAIRCLLDERLGMAEKGFQRVLGRTAKSIDALDERAPAMDILARLGLGLVAHRRSRFESAEQTFALANRRAHAFALPLLAGFAEVFRVLNRSEQGGKPPDQWRVERSREGSGIVAFVLDCVRARCVARLAYRSGDRETAKEALASVIEDPRFVSLGPVLRGVMIRERAILCAFCNDPHGARDGLMEALRVFADAGYQPGVVRATLSLARSHCFMDQGEAEDDLHRAAAILRNPSATTAAREMRLELGELESRMGDLFFVQGQFERAEAHYRCDRELMLELGSPLRSISYIDFNLGRVRLATGGYEEAAQSLEGSARGFERAGDYFNALRSYQWLIEALLEAGKAPAAAAALEVAERLLEKLPRRADRRQQLASIEMLRARLDLVLRQDADTAQARIDEALELLATTAKDAYYIRALLVSAQIREAKGDARLARGIVAKASRLAEACQLADLQIRADRAARDLPPGEAAHDETGSIEAACRHGVRAERDAAVLVVGIRGYVQIAEQSGADAVWSLSDLLDEYARSMAGCAELHDGELVRFDGTTLVVIFEDVSSGLPREMAASRAALQMHQRFRDLRARWQRRSPLPLKHLGIGAGIGVGRIVAGFFGMRARREFAVVGAPVNQAAALEQASADGVITVSRAVGVALARLWPALGLSAREVRSTGHGLLHAFQIDGLVAQLPPPVPSGARAGAQVDDTLF